MRRGLPCCCRGLESIPCQPPHAMPQKWLHNGRPSVMDPVILSRSIQVALGARSLKPKVGRPSRKWRQDSLSKGRSKQCFAYFRDYEPVQSAFALVKSLNRASQTQSASCPIPIDHCSDSNCPSLTNQSLSDRVWLSKAKCR
jgi:hypothetical protein